MKVLLTGAGGFLGWHTRARLRALTDHEVVAVGRDRFVDLAELTRGVDAVVHVAGVNRGGAGEVEQGNVTLAENVADAVRASGTVSRLVFANSIQTGNDTPYGTGKARASDVLAAAAADVGAHYVDVALPNLFGEHGRPRYNSFVATFVDDVIAGREPQVDDREVELLHVQAAAQVLIDALGEPGDRLTPPGTPTTVRTVLDTLRSFNELYRTGDVPPLLTDLDVDLFNTLRAAKFPDHYPIPLTPRTDDRGSLVEVVRAHGGQGQTFVSTTHPGVTRGEHFHLRKVERFVVLGGQARISLRRLFDDPGTGADTRTVSFDVDGEHPVVVDMPTLWVHNITNTGSADLTTVFWTHELFDPAAPDTFAEPVHPQPAGPSC